MSMTDPIADLLTRIRNAAQAKHEHVTIPYSKLKEGVIAVLRESGFVKGMEKVEEGAKSKLVVTLKYTGKGERIIGGLKRISKPGRRVYVGYSDLRPIRSGMGVAILSTPKGVMSDLTARKEKLGGEWLVSVW